MLRRAAALGAAALARDLIERSLGAEWNGALVLLYGELQKLEAPKAQEEARIRIERAERWLREHAEDPQLLAALGRLCMTAELWGKAQNYLEASLSFGPSRAAHLELARLAEREGRAAEAQKHFRRAGELPGLVLFFEFWRFFWFRFPRLRRSIRQSRSGSLSPFPSAASPTSTRG
jgi:HemY protein